MITPTQTTTLFVFLIPKGTECNERDQSTCPVGKSPPPPVTEGTLLPHADHSKDDPEPTPLKGRSLTFKELLSEGINATADSSLNFQIHGGLILPKYWAKSYPVTGTDQILPLGCSFKLVLGEHPQLEADLKLYAGEFWDKHKAEIIAGLGIGLAGVGCSCR